ncbi:hypothetical protein Enr17x_06840 [Gimesia fumaroli]|uniref:Uncharacterized protein n=1 Tax=Gimesia fumaroli TaxID=2527976 RepID=A0A518I6D7_9PLAN|nr:hypothetical protein Enr17x_06840 [Gimesia fumaroli]
MLQSVVDVVNVRIISVRFMKNWYLRRFSRLGFQITKMVDFLLNQGMLCCGQLAACSETRRAIERFLVPFFQIRMTS